MYELAQGFAVALVAAVVLYGIQGLVEPALPNAGWAVFVGILLGTLVTMAQRIRREIDSRYRRTEALLALYGTITPRLPLPMPREYAASPELLRAVVDTVLEVQPRYALELGSGVSTLVAAYAMERVGQGEIVSLEHEACFAEATNALLRRHGLDHVASVVHAPLIPTIVEGRRYLWYDTRALGGELEGAVGLLVVDGPPGRLQRLSRYPALPVLGPQLRPDATVLVDDARRRDERIMVRRWRSARPELRAEYLATEKGTVWLRSGPR